jgi:hypothetical protein
VAAIEGSGGSVARRSLHVNDLSYTGRRFVRQAISAARMDNMSTNLDTQVQRKVYRWKTAVLAVSGEQVIFRFTYGALFD